ncbi:hypothetical protein V6N13_098521 [Hibiscus sabdariffa]
MIDPNHICYPTIAAFIEEVGIPRQNIKYLAYLEPCFSLDGGLRNLGTENVFREIDEDGHVVGETEVNGPVGVENNDVGPNVGEIEVAGLVVVENNDGVNRETEVVGHVLGETEDDGPVLGETKAVGPLYEDTDFVGPILGERDDWVNVGSEEVGRSCWSKPKDQS